MKNSGFFPLVLGSAFIPDNLNENNSFPVLSVFYDVTNAGSANGSESAPYEIRFPQQMGMLDYMYGTFSLSDDAYFALKTNLHMGAEWEIVYDEVQLTRGKAFKSIGATSGLIFKGVFDGGNHSISGICALPDVWGNAVFITLGENALVKNLGIRASCFSGNNGVGSIAVRNNGTITNCYNTSTLMSGSNFVGGIVSDNYGLIENCFNTGSVKGWVRASGIAGYNNGTISGCFNTGPVLGHQLVAGITGYNEGNINNCFNTGSVSGESFVGGIGGDNYVLIENCQNSGTITSEIDYIGGISGGNYTGTIANCISTGILNNTGGGQCFGGISGDNASGSVTNSYYLTGTAGKGIGYGTGETTAVSMDLLTSGVVAWMLQSDQADLFWGHSVLESDELPQLIGFNQDAVRVVQIAFIDDTTASYAYVLQSGTVAFPTPSKTGYSFIGWEDSEGDAVAPGTTFATDTNLYAVWEHITYTVTLPSGTGYTATAKSGSASPVNYGGSFSFTVALDAEYNKSGITVKANGSTLTPVDGVYTIENMTTDQTVTVENVLLNTYALTVINGTGSGSYPADATVNLVADAPPEGYIFDGWTSGNEVTFADSTDASTTFTMPSGDITVTANYRPVPVKPPADQNQIVGLKDGDTFEKGDTVDLTATGAGMGNVNPNKGDTRWLPVSYSGAVTGGWTSESYYISFSTEPLEPGSHTITVIFRQQQFDGSDWVDMDITYEMDIEFTVLYNSIPDTGDHQPPLWLLMVVLLCVVAMFYGLYRRKVRD